MTIAENGSHASCSITATCAAAPALCFAPAGCWYGGRRPAAAATARLAAQGQHPAGMGWPTTFGGLPAAPRVCPAASLQQLPNGCSTAQRENQVWVGSGRSHSILDRLEHFWPVFNVALLVALDTLVLQRRLGPPRREAVKSRSTEHPCPKRGASETQPSKRGHSHAHADDHSRRRQHLLAAAGAAHCRLSRRFTAGCLPCPGPVLLSIPVGLPRFGAGGSVATTPAGAPSVAVRQLVNRGSTAARLPAVEDSKRRDRLLLTGAFSGYLQSRRTPDAAAGKR